MPEPLDNVTLSIVSYSQRDMLDRCLRQLGKLDLPTTCETIVVDNNSMDDSADLVEKSYPWVKLIRLQKNRGFGGGHNVAYAQTNKPYFFVLNPDVIVSTGSLDELVEIFMKFPRAAVVGPCLLNPDGSFQYSARRFYTWRTIFSRRLPMPGRKKINDYHLMKEWDHKVVRKVDWILGAAMGIRREAFARKELFDPRYTLYFEDVDLCYFARKEGWDVLYCPDSKMIHDHQRESANGLVNKALFHHFISWLKFNHKSKKWDK